MHEAHAEAGRARPKAWDVHGAVGLTDRGLVLGAGSVLVRMVKGATPRLALEADRDRLFAMLSVAVGEPVESAGILHHLEAASQHWQRGDKALANLRLVIARLPVLTDAAAIGRLALAEEVLDGGTEPAALMKAIWPNAGSEVLGKYNPAEPRVPSGDEGGWWTRADGGRGSSGASHNDGRITVAMEDEPDNPEDVPHVHPGFAGRPTPELGHNHFHPLDPLTGLPANSARVVPTGKLPGTAESSVPGALTLYRGDRAGLAVFKSYAVQQGGIAKSVSVLSNGNTDDLMNWHQTNSESPPSPFVSVTSDLETARFFAGLGAVYELRLSPDRVFRNPHNPEEKEYLVPHQILPSEIIKITLIQK